jgi:hypothetical protein
MPPQSDKPLLPWWTIAFLGLVLNGSGLSLLGEAIISKSAPSSAVGDWFWSGTFSLVLINAGICLVVEAAWRKNHSQVTMKKNGDAAAK